MNATFNNNTANRDNLDAPEAPINTRKYSFESFKQSLFKKLESLTGNTSRQVLNASRNSLRSSASVSVSGSIENLDEVLSQPFEPLVREVSIFRPALHKTLEVPANIGFNYGANVYNQKHNMIIACPSNSNVHFFDASSLRAMRKRSKKSIDSSVVQMSYCELTDTHLMGCAFGDIYAYNASTNNLFKVMKQGDSFVLGITYISPTVFAFSSSKTGQLFIGDMTTKKAEPHYSFNSDAWYLHNIKEKNILLSGLANGMIAIYNSKKGPQYPLIDSIQAHRFGKYVTSIINVTIKGRDYIVTGGNDHTLKIWHFVKGKMRLLKSIPTDDDVSTIVYLEDYKMIATTHHKDYIKFFKLPYGSLEATLPLGLSKARNIFLMPDKKCLGIADLSKNVIKVVKLNSNVVAQSR